LVGANIKQPGRRTVKCAIFCACVKMAVRGRRKICAVAPATLAAVIAALNAATADAISPATRAMHSEIVMQLVASAVAPAE
jgi:hypothetical protein